MADRFYPLIMAPGIQRDGTNFAGKSYIDGQWCRFQRGMPRKMGGYSQLIGGLVNIPRGIAIIPNSSMFDFYVGDNQGVNRYTYNNQRALINSTPVTPGDFVVNNSLLWDFGVMYSTIDEGAIIIGYAGNNLNDINNSTNMPIYIKESGEDAIFVKTEKSVSGGFVILHPFLFAFGNNGEVSWGEPNKPEVWQGENSDRRRICGQKIVHAESCRSTIYNPGPSGLFWSTKGLYKAIFVGSPAIFKFDTIDNECSILSSRSVVSYDGLFYWVSNDRFMVTDGVTTREIPNKTNLNFFFDSLNPLQKQKIWGEKITKYGEIWWHFPKGNADECNAAIIFNIRENCWYDTEISRTCGVLEPIFSNPVWCSTDTIWEHETGLDQNINGNRTAINSYFETGNIAWCAVSPDKQWKGIERFVQLNRIEPDFKQQGNLNLFVNGRNYARSKVDSLVNNLIIDENKEKIDLRAQAREMTMEIVSNEIGGFYELGNTLLDITIGDVRPGGDKE